VLHNLGRWLSLAVILSAATAALLLLLAPAVVWDGVHAHFHALVECLDRLRNRQRDGVEYTTCALCKQDTPVVSMHKVVSRISPVEFYIAIPA
jgi:hypothetical protein